MAYYSYVYRSGSGIYYFRLKIPSDYKIYFNNKNEIRNTLKTRSKKEALQIAQELAGVYRQRFSKLDLRVENETRRVIIQEPIDLLESRKETSTVCSREYLISNCILTYFENIKLRQLDKGILNIKEQKPVFDRLIEIIGDKDIRDINFIDVNNFFSKIQKLPANMRKFFVNNETIDEIIESEKTKSLIKLSPRTINKYMERASTFFKFFVQTGILSRNIFENKNLRIIHKDRACDRKERFSESDLRLIFSEDGGTYNNIIKNKSFKEAYYWVPLIALYTGARVSEISQLHVNDILKIEDIWCISIAETTDVPISDITYKSLKNKSSCRIVPIHDELIRLGFIQFTEKARNNGQIRLFNDIVRKKKGVYSSIVGGWFNKNKKRYFNLNNPKQTFHSFRHTFIDNLKQCGVKEELVAVVVGHARRGITFNVYGKDFSVKYIKNNVIDLVSYKIVHKIL